MCFVDLEPCEVWDERDRKARKEHKCSACGGKITVGSLYVVHFNVFEGEAKSDKMCKPCEAARREFAKDHDGMLCMPRELINMIRECIGEEGGEEFANPRWIELIAEMNARLNGG